MCSIITGDKDRIEFFGGKRVEKEEQASNKYLWKAALEVMSFMPITSADVKNNIIITDWYSSKASSNERFKFNILVLTNQLKANTIKITGFREVKNKSGNWEPAQLSNQLIIDLENKILTKARALRLARD
jgi:hypothetical protein